VHFFAAQVLPIGFIADAPQDDAPTMVSLIDFLPPR